MPLKTVLESLEGVDDAHKGLYTEVDKKFVLDIEGVDDHPQVKNLKSAFDAQKVRNQEISGKYAELELKVKELPDDFDAAKWLELKTAAERDKTKRDKDVENLQSLHEARIQALTQAHDARVSEKDTEIQGLDRQLDDLLVSTQLTDVLVGVNVAKEFLEAAKLVVGRKVQVVKNETSGERKVVVETNVGPQPMKDFVRTWAETDEGKPFIAKATGLDTKGGTGSRFSGVDNPFTSPHWNKTKQQTLPVEKREEMARAAGFKDFNTAIMSPRPVKPAA